MYIKYPSDENFSWESNAKETDADFYNLEDSARRIENDEDDYNEESRSPSLSDFSPLKNNLVKKVIPHNYHHKPKCPHCNKIYVVTKPCTCCGFYSGNKKHEKYKLKEGVEYKYKDRCPLCEAPYTPKEPCFNCGYFIGKPIFYPFNKIIPNPLYTGKCKREDDFDSYDKVDDFSHIEDDNQRNEGKYSYKNQGSVLAEVPTTDEEDILMIEKMKNLYKEKPIIQEETVEEAVEKIPEIKKEEKIQAVKPESSMKEKIIEKAKDVAKDKAKELVKEKVKEKVVEKIQEKKKYKPVPEEKIEKIEIIKEKPKVEKEVKVIPTKKINTKIELQKIDMIEIKGSIKAKKSPEKVQATCVDNTMYEFIDNEYFDSCDWKTSEEKIEGKSKCSKKDKDKEKDKHKDKDKQKEKHKKKDKEHHKSKDSDKCKDKKKESKRKKR